MIVPRAGAAALAIVGLLVAFAPAGAQTAAPLHATAHTTPAGIVFRHFAVSSDTYHALAFAWPDGYALAVPAKAGVAVLGPRLLLEGSRTTGQSARIEHLKDLQASLGLSGGAHFTSGMLSAPPKNLAAAAGLLAELLADPALPADRLALAKRSLAVSSRQQQENAETLANRLFMRLTLSPGPLLNLTIAEPAVYEAIEVADVAAWRSATLGRDRLVIVSAGPMAAADVGVEIDRIFAGLPGLGPAQPIPAPQLRAAGKLIVVERPVVQTAIVAGGPSGWTAEPDLLRGSVAVRVLGSGFEGRLMRAVRERLGAAYGISARLQQLHVKALTLVVSTSVDNGKAAAALAAIRGEYDSFHRDGVTAAEIEPLKTKLVDELRESLRRSSGAALQLRGETLAGYPADHLATYADRVRALTVEDVNDGIRARFPKAPLTIVMVTPSAEGLGADCVIKAAEELARCE